MKAYKKWFDLILKDTNYLGKSLSEAAWKHQQTKIDRLEAKLDKANYLISMYDSFLTDNALEEEFTNDNAQYLEEYINE